MDIALRILHIVFGIFWAGTTFYATLILMPQLRALGPAIERPAMKALLRVTSPTMMASSLIVLGSGLAMAFRMGWGLDTMLATGWGVVMLIAFIAIVLALIFGFGILAPTGSRIEKLGRKIGGRNPTADEAQQLDRLITRINLVERINFVLILIGVFTMPISRFV